MADEVLPVLLAEDEEHDVFFMRRAFQATKILNPLVSVPNGQEAISYLEAEAANGQHGGNSEPQLLLLDLKMPLVNGFEVLEWIQGQPRWRDRLPVVVLSSSGYEEDRKKALALGAKDYLVKPTDFEGLVELVRQVKAQWL
jgi:two-component system response regulator